MLLEAVSPTRLDLEEWIVPFSMIFVGRYRYGYEGTNYVSHKAAESSNYELSFEFVVRDSIDYRLFGAELIRPCGGRCCKRILPTK